MNNAKPKVVIELSSTTINIIVGYILNNKPVILYSNTIDVHNSIKNGKIEDMKFLINLLKKISYIEVKELKLKLNIKNVILVLPSVNLKIYKIKKKIHKNVLINLKNFNFLIEKEINSKNKIIDIKSLFFYINGHKMLKLPSKITGNFLSVEVIVYTIPKKVVNDYLQLFENSEINIQKKIISAYAIAYVIPEQTYIYVDIGFDYTNMVFISKKILYKSINFKLGGSKITQIIAEKFHTNLIEAEKIKRIYGYTTDVNSFNPIIFSNNFDNKEISYTVLDLNNIIEDYLNEYFEYFDKKLDNFFLNYQGQKKNCPIFFGGGGSKLNGLSFFLNKKYNKYNINFVKLDVIGARHEKYLNCIGALFY